MSTPGANRPRYLVCAAWPYINYVPHLGTIIPLLSADVVARFLRMRGHEVLFVSGSDEHGTPIEVEAVRQGIEPRELTDRNHELVVRLFKEWRLSLDSYIRTEHPTHKEFVRRFYERVYANGYVFERDEELPYCERCGRFLPDRFVEGTCPYCGYEKARGDQCEACGRLMDPARLVDPRCAICGSRPVIKKTRHWFLDLTRLQEPVERYVRSNEQFSEPVKAFSLRMLEEGLRPRSITRDTRWGIPAPFPGAEGKTIYCWFEAVLGYISATITYFEARGQRERWEDFWKDPGTRSVFFIGKDNIPFHTILLPALLLAADEGYNLPWNVVSNEFLLWEGEKFSKSRRVGIWIDEALELFPADYWRFVLVALRPELRDSNFTWEQFVEKVNAELIGNVGNFIHRTLVLIKRHFGGRVPEPGRLGKADERPLKVLRELFEEATRELYAFRLRSALRDVVDVAREGNRYLNEREPWRLVREDPELAGTALYVAAQLVKALAVMMAPFTPEAADRLWGMLNLPGSVHEASWEEALRPLEPGHIIGEPKPLFRKVPEDPGEMRRALEELRARCSG